MYSQPWVVTNGTVPTNTPPQAKRGITTPPERFSRTSSIAACLCRWTTGSTLHPDVDGTVRFVARPGLNILGRRTEIAGTIRNPNLAPGGPFDVRNPGLCAVLYLASENIGQSKMLQSPVWASVHCSHDGFQSFPGESRVPSLIPSVCGGLYRHHREQFIDPSASMEQEQCCGELGPCDLPRKITATTISRACTLCARLD